MPNDYFVSSSGDASVQDSISNFIDWMRAQKIVFCEPHLDKNYQTEYVLFEGDIKGLVTAFLARQ